MVVQAPGVIPIVARRDAETAALVALVEAAARGSASALLVSGEAGVGKTSLVRQVCTRPIGSR